jgi:hypothetical protein
VPPQELAIVQQRQRNFVFKETITQELLRLWLARARFLRWLEDKSELIRPQSYNKKTYCELCKRPDDLLVQSIYTMQKLASIYRSQRDTSPLFNLRLWHHFYKVFTPTCTICAPCYNYYRTRGKDIPVDDRRFAKMQPLGSE